MKTDLDLLPRADLPVIWSDFKIRADAVWSVVDSLVVTDVSQKEAMALARKTRLTLREIRIAVEHKRVELGEGHLKEIQKVNGAAKAIREFIEPLEARLLLQESFAERAEADRIAELTHRRTAELYALSPKVIVADIGTMSQENYNSLMDTLKAEQVEKEAANRLRVEAERKLAEAQAEAERQRKETAAILNAKLEAQRKEAEEKAQEVYAELKRQNEAEQAIRVIERLRLDAEKAVRDADLAEQKRIRDEQYAALEAELEKERAEKREKFLAECAERNRLRCLALAPDAAKLKDFANRIQGIKCPAVVSDEAQAIVHIVSDKFNEIIFHLNSL